MTKAPLPEWAAVVLGFASVLAAGLLSYDAAMILAGSLCVLVAALYRPRRLRGLLPALLIPAVWILLSGDFYAGYNRFAATLFGLSLFPLIAWPSGLFFAYAWIFPLFRIPNWPRRWLVISLLYALVLIAMEWVGYHLLGIHLDAGRAYPGWPVLDIFHSPPMAQAAYFAIGFAFAGWGSWLDRKDPGFGGGPAA